MFLTLHQLEKKLSLLVSHNNEPYDALDTVMEGLGRTDYASLLVTEPSLFEWVVEIDQLLGNTYAPTPGAALELAVREYLGKFVAEFYYKKEEDNGESAR